MSALKPDSYLFFVELVVAWQSSNYCNFDEVESFFFGEVFPDQSPGRLRFHVEMHRLIKLIKSDLAMLKASRSEERRQNYRTKIKERSDSLIQLSQACLGK